MGRHTEITHVICTTAMEANVQFLPIPAPSGAPLRGGCRALGPLSWAPSGLTAGGQPQCLRGCPILCHIAGNIFRSQEKKTNLFQVSIFQKSYQTHSILYTAVACTTARSIRPINDYAHNTLGERTHTDLCVNSKSIQRQRDHSVPNLLLQKTEQ